jgi:hypothetical protein
MKVVNPFGKVPVIRALSVLAPRTCICDPTQAYSILDDFGWGDNCACGCRADFEMNNTINHNTSYNYNY